MAHDARAIANYFLDIAKDARVGVSHLSLHKIIYFAQGWHLANQSRTLIINPIEAWNHGPVIPVVYEEFKHAQAEPIRSRACRWDFADNCKKVFEYRLSDLERSFLTDTFNMYAKVDPFILSDMTHLPGSPWDQVWNRRAENATAGMKISNELIREYFLSLSQHHEIH